MIVIITTPRIFWEVMIIGVLENLASSARMNMRRATRRTPKTAVLAGQTERAARPVAPKTAPVQSQLPATDPVHPALRVLVRLLARQAAQDLTPPDMAAAGGHDDG